MLRRIMMVRMRMRMRSRTRGENLLIVHSMGRYAVSRFKKIESKQ